VAKYITDNHTGKNISKNPDYPHTFPTIGHSVRSDMIPRMKVPGADTYNIKGDFEKGRD
jgi:hypothetical protein